MDPVPWLNHDLVIRLSLSVCVLGYHTRIETHGYFQSAAAIMISPL